MTGYLHRQGILVIPYLGDWLIHHPDRKVLLRHQAQLINTLDLVGFVLNRKKSELDLTQDFLFLRIRLSLDLGEASLPESKAWEIVARAILPPCTNLYSSVPAYGVTQWGLRSYPSGSFVPETPPTSFSLVRSDRPVYATVSIRPSGSCQPSAALAGPMFSYLRNPNPHVSGGFHDFYGRLHAGVGRHMGDSQISGIWAHTDRKLHINCLELKAVVCALQHWAPVLQGHQVMIATDNSTVVSYINKQGGTPFPHLATFDSRTSPLVRGSEHYSPSTTYSRLPERDSRPPILSKSANIDPEIVKRIFRVCGTPEVDSVELPPSSVHVSNSGATSLSGGCSVS